MVSQTLIQDGRILYLAIAQVIGHSVVIDISTAY